ncbi:MAG TPA: nucleoside 2-deoxyribosyltransferase [Acidimicrobiales bacterium]|nr:nucleoside 2-deoxyribosyltransferase [Acidimicrobiales bacterium]
MRDRPLVYLAGPLGFTEPGRRFHDEVVVPAVRAAGFDVADPWTGGGDIETALGIVDHDERRRALVRANRAAGAANASMIDRADGVLAVLDGSDVDSGTAAEIGYAAALEVPVVGWRSDLRDSGDNEATVVNLQVEHFIERSGGVIESSLDGAIAALSAAVAG